MRIVLSGFVMMLCLTGCKPDDFGNCKTSPSIEGKLPSNPIRNEGELIAMIDERTAELPNQGGKCKRHAGSDTAKLDKCHDAYEAAYASGTAFANAAADMISSGHFDCDKLQQMAQKLDGDIATLTELTGETKGQDAFAVGTAVVSFVTSLYDKYLKYSQDDRDRVAKIIQSHGWKKWSEID